MRRESGGDSGRAFTVLTVGQPVFVNGLAGTVTRFEAARWGEVIYVEVNGVELPYHPADFNCGTIELVEREQAR